MSSLESFEVVSPGPASEVKKMKKPSLFCENCAATAAAHRDHPQEGHNFQPNKATIKYRTWLADQEQRRKESTKKRGAMMIVGWVRALKETTPESSGSQNVEVPPSEPSTSLHGEIIRLGLEAHDAAAGVDPTQWQ